MALQAPEEAELLLYRKGYKAPYWRAPELLRGEPPTKATDVYAYGMLLYEILYRREPFEKENKEVRLQSSTCTGMSVRLDRLGETKSTKVHVRSPVAGQMP